jgi:hypothetical protein
MVEDFDSRFCASQKGHIGLSKNTEESRYFLQSLTIADAGSKQLAGISIGHITVPDISNSLTK